MSDNPNLKQRLVSSMENEPLTPNGVYIENVNSNTKNNPNAFLEDIPERTTAKEVRGWYLYDWANGAWFYSAMNFLPIMITSQAREVAIEQFCQAFSSGYEDCITNANWADNYEEEGACSDPTYETNSSCVDRGLEWTADLNGDAKNLTFLGIPIGYASFSLCCTFLSVIVQLIIYISMGSFADFGGNRKKMLILTNTIGLISAFLVIFMSADDLYWVNGLLYIIGVSAFSFAQVFYNAYLPLLAAAQPVIVSAKEDGASSDTVAALEKEVTHNMSLKGLASGFTGQLIFLILNLGILKLVTSDEYWNTRISIFATGMWVLVFSTMAFCRLKKRPGPPLPSGESYVQHSIKSAHRTFKSFKKLTELGWFLLSYFVFSDGTSTLSGAAAIFAQEELKMTAFEIGLALIEVSICAVVGCFFFRWVHEKYGVSSKRILLFNLAMMGILPVYGLISLTQKWEFYMGIFIFGINTGSQQAFTRSIFAHHLPYGREAEYFSFYEISDKGTAWLGPLMIAIINSYTGSFRSSFGSLIFFFVVGIALLSFFDPAKAEEQKKIFDLEDVERTSSVIIARKSATFSQTDA